MSKGMGFSLDCKALGVAGAQGMCGGGQERRTQGRQGQLVKSLTRHSRREVGLYPAGHRASRKDLWSGGK